MPERPLAARSGAAGGAASLGGSAAAGEWCNSDRPQPRARIHDAGCRERRRQSHRRQPPAAAGQAGDITLNFVDTDIREIARTILGTTLKLNYTIDPNVHGTGSIDTGTPLPRSALLPTLETLLNANGATLVERNGVYAVVPIAVGNTTNPVSGANAIGAGTQVVPLRYAAARDLAKVLEPYVAEGGKITADAGTQRVARQR